MATRKKTSKKTSRTKSKSPTKTKRAAVKKSAAASRGKAATKKKPAARAPKQAPPKKAKESAAKKAPKKRSGAKASVRRAPAATGPVSASKAIDAKIESLGDWRGDTLAKLRSLIRDAVPDVVEEVKWGGVPVWSKDGIITTGETYKEVVKLTFAKGASLPDPKRVFNSSLEGNLRRAIDVREGEMPDSEALTALVREAASLNETTVAGRKPKRG